MLRIRRGMRAVALDTTSNRRVPFGAIAPMNHALDDPAARTAKIGGTAPFGAVYGLGGVSCAL